MQLFTISTQIISMGMLYMDNHTSAQRIAVPLYSQPSGNTFTMAIKRSTTGDNYTSLTATYVSKDRLFVVLSVTLSSGLADGEYEYIIKEGDSIVGGGIVQITGAVYADIEHNQNITYKEYESNQI